MPNNNYFLSANQIKLFTSLFNRSGYVLDFSNKSFNTFTKDSVGVALCEAYNLSKGKSLEAFCRDGDESSVIKLLSDLLEHYEAIYYQEIEINNPKFSKEYYGIYKKCKSILNNLPKTNVHITKSVNDILCKFSSEYLEHQVALLLDMQEKFPTESIGKSKELIETCCKNILTNENVVFDPSIDINGLIKLTMKTLKIHIDDIKESNPEIKTIKKILGSLSGIAIGISELRNSYGSGHGKNIDFKGLSSRHAELCIGASITLVKYLWSTYEWKKNFI